MRGHARTSASRIKEAEVTCPLNLQRGGQEAAINHSSVSLLLNRGHRASCFTCLLSC